jgi:hypothetical protein
MDVEALVKVGRGQSEVGFKRNVSKGTAPSKATASKRQRSGEGWMESGRCHF